MSERDELIQIIWDDAVADRVKDGKDPRNVPVVRPKVEGMADKILAAGYRKPRTLAKPYDLDALPSGSAVQTSDPSDVVLLKGTDGWFRNQDGAELDAATLWRYGTRPFTVIYDPKSTL